MPVALLAVLVAGLVVAGGLALATGLLAPPALVVAAAPPLPAAPSLPAPAADTPCTSNTVSGYGQSILVDAGAWVCGDANAYGGSVTVRGHVSGNVSAFGGGVTVSGQVDGNVVAAGGDVTLEPGARVGGDVDSWGGSVHREADSFVSGNVGRGQWVFNSFGGSWLGVVQQWIFPWSWVLFWIVLAAVIVPTFPERTARVGAVARRALVRSASVGLLTAIMGLGLVAALFVTRVGIPVSLVVVLVLLVGWLIGTVAVALGLGSWVLGAVAPRARSPLLRAVVGVTLLGGAESIPYAGAAIAVLVSVLGLGATLLSRFGSPRLATRRQLPVAT